MRTPGNSIPLARIEIEHDLYEAMLNHLRASAPNEGCGLIAVEGERAVKLYPGTNTESSATRYNMNPAEVKAALDDICRQGWHLGAIFHSHPQTSPVPSPTDLQYAYYPESLMIIVSLASEPPEARAFQIDGEKRVVRQEVPIICVSETQVSES